MAKFFSTLVNKGLIREWTGVLDWLLDENRFSEEKGWTPSQVRKFTNNIKKEFDLLDNSKYQVGALKNLIFPNTINGVKNPTNTIMMIAGDSEGRNIVRHIRNGVAHGRIKFIERKKELLIEIIDYGNNEQTKVSNTKSSKNAEKKTGKLKQSAFICIPANYIQRIYEIYLNLEKSQNNDRSKEKNKTAKTRKKS